MEIMNDMIKTGKENSVKFPTEYVPLGTAWAIFKSRLDDPEFSFLTKALAIRRVAEAETHNSITKDEMIYALRWLCKHIDWDDMRADK